MTNHIFLTLWKYIKDASNLIVPQRCAICRRRLHIGEEGVCISCFSDLPFTGIKGKQGNKIERLFWGKLPIVRANALLKYMPQSESSRIFLSLKYGNRPDIGKIFGRIMARDLQDTDFFDSIDFLVPIPLAKDRLRKRGYNQSECLALGVKDITGIPIDTKSVIRSISNESQTKFSAEERRKNVEGIFTLTSTSSLKNKHVLIIDDILTTGSTLLSCAQALNKIEGLKISILTLGLAGSHYHIDRKSDNN